MKLAKQQSGWAVIDPSSGFIVGGYGPLDVFGSRRTAREVAKEYAQVYETRFRVVKVFIGGEE